MSSQQLETITQMLRARRERVPPDISFPESRAMFEQMVAAFPAPEGVSSKPVDAGGVAGEWITAPGAGGEQTLYCCTAEATASAPLTRTAPCSRAFLLPQVHAC